MPLSGRIVGFAALLATLSGGLAGCDAFNKGFNQAFDKKMHDSCVQSAISHQAAADAAEKYCGCIVQQLSSLSVQEKENLSAASPKAQQAVARCKPAAS
jgi:hypothetical protein